MTNIQTTWTDEHGETWVPLSDYMHLTAQLEKQNYTYYGKDGRPVLARDLEDQLEAAKGRIAELERALGALKYWFDTDPEILDAMSTDELADHTRQASLIEAALIAADEQTTEKNDD